MKKLIILITITVSLLFVGFVYQGDIKELDARMLEIIDNIDDGFFVEINETVIMNLTVNETSQSMDAMEINSNVKLNIESQYFELTTETKGFEGTTRIIEVRNNTLYNHSIFHNNPFDVYSEILNENADQNSFNEELENLGFRQDVELKLRNVKQEDKNVFTARVLVKNAVDFLGEEVIVSFDDMGVNINYEFLKFRYEFDDDNLGYKLDLRIDNIVTDVEGTSVSLDLIMCQDVRYSTDLEKIDVFDSYRYAHRLPDSIDKIFQTTPGV